MKRIPLTKGKFAIVDDEDFKYINQWKWYLNVNGYAMTTTKPRMYMHRLINKTPKGLLTDHINQHPLDNRKINLRTCDKRLNSLNRVTQPNNTSGYRGISWSKQKSKWEAYVWDYGHKIHLGLFSNIIEAVLAREEGEKNYYEKI